MNIWTLLKLLMWLVANLPTLISFIKKMIDLADGDKKLVKECVKEFCALENEEIHKGLGSAMEAMTMPKGKSVAPKIGRK